LYLRSAHKAFATADARQIVSSTPSTGARLGDLFLSREREPGRIAALENPTLRIFFFFFLVIFLGEGASGGSFSPHQR